MNLRRRIEHPRRNLLGVLALSVLAAGALLAASTSAGAPVAGSRAARALAPAINVDETCDTRVPPRSRIDVGATVTNPGDEALAPPLVDGDAGTPENQSDDFVLAFQSGDANGNNLLDPGERWAYTGSYTAGTEDVTNTVGAEAVSVPGGTDVSDIDACTTDVIQVPVPGVIVGVSPVRGTVLVRRKGQPNFVPLEHATEIPVGSQVDTTRGTVRLTAGLGGGQTNSADFYDGIFTIVQRRAARALTELRLNGGNFGTCRRRGTSASAVDFAGAPPKRPVRRLWGSGKGRFSTRGRYSSATVRGTIWLTQDQCNGTLTRVRQGVVLVRDFVKRKNIILRAGRKYLARPKR